MNPLTGQKTAVLDNLQKAINAFQEDGPLVQQIMTSRLNPATEAQRQAMRRQIINQLQAAYDAERTAASTDPWYAPQNSVVALVQSAMEQHLGPTLEQSQRRAIVDAAGIPLPERFGSTDPGWIEVAIDAFGTLLEGKAPFVSHVNLGDFMSPIRDQCTVALVSDWGADNDPAIHVRDQIAALKPDYVIHLGDIYYAGQDNEAESFLGHWPFPSHASFALNGNHEMYSGGRAYFEKVLPAFTQPASYFGLYNQNWQFLGLDTAYIDHRLTSPEDSRLDHQFAWLIDKLKDPARASIVLTHHQPFSAYQPEHDNAAQLRDDITRIYEHVGPDPIYGWFFGHEHKCTIYDDSYSSYRARLIGHGCIPHLIPDPATDPPIPYLATNRTPRPDASGYAISGFALLRLNGPVVNIAYINEDGTVWNRETWSRKVGAGIGA